MPPLLHPPAVPASDSTRDRLLGFRVTRRWLARWKRDLARIKADTGISSRALSLIVLDVLVESVPTIRERAVRHPSNHLI
jgi:hypothetical protein